ncbi:MAG: hypothetical protein H7296_03040 [Bacteroidia bacterium]|nr:hypothetical protein [Bacteroidia bacterium]
MKAKQIIVKTLLIFLIGCAIGKRGVYLNEMPTKPFLKVNEDTLNIRTQNSIINSALRIYKIYISVEQKQKRIFVSADQAVNKQSKEIFKIELRDYKVTNPNSYEYF